MRAQTTKKEDELLALFFAVLRRAAYHGHPALATFAQPRR